MFQACTKVGDAQGQPYSSVVFTELGMWYHASKGPFPCAYSGVCVAVQSDQRDDVSEKRSFEKF